MSTAYQPHSNTSQEAAENFTGGEQQRNHVYSVIHDKKGFGATTDEIKVILLSKGLIHQNSVMSARVRELELSGTIVKTTAKRKTSAGRKANVYVTKSIFNAYPCIMHRDETKPESKIAKLEQEALTPKHKGLGIFKDIFRRNPHLHNTFLLGEFNAIIADLEKV